MAGQSGLTNRRFAIGILVLVVVGVEAYELGQMASGRPVLRASNSPVPSIVSPSPSALPSPSPQSSPSPSFAPVVPIHNSLVDSLQCKLPVYEIGVAGSGAFVSFPNGGVALDPSSNLPPGTGAGYWYALSYDPAVHSWLPVPATWVAPNGGLYFTNGHIPGNNMMYEVNAQTGAATELGISPLGYGWQTLAVTPNFAYATSLNSHSGLYVMPIAAPYSQELYVTDGYWTAAFRDYVYGSVTPGGGSIIRIDANKQVVGNPPIDPQTWFNKPGSAQVLGFDASGAPVIWTGTELWIASAPDQAVLISSGPPLADPNPNGDPLYGANAPVADTHGLWFSTTAGIYLYANGQTTKVSNLVAQVAGPCL